MEARAADAPHPAIRTRCSAAPSSASSCPRACMAGGKSRRGTRTIEGGDDMSSLGPEAALRDDELQRFKQEQGQDVTPFHAPKGSGLRKRHLRRHLSLQQRAIPGSRWGYGPSRHTHPPRPRQSSSIVDCCRCRGLARRRPVHRQDDRARGIRLPGSCRSPRQTDAPREQRRNEQQQTRLRAARLRVRACERSATSEPPRAIGRFQRRDSRCRWEVRSHHRGGRRGNQGRERVRPFARTGARAARIGRCRSRRPAGWVSAVVFMVRGAMPSRPIAAI